MKLSLATATAILAFTTTAQKPEGQWRCEKPTGGTNKELYNAVVDFDRLFGTRHLRAAGGQCYMSMCRGYFFQWCNTAKAVREELDHHRGWAKDRSLPNGGHGSRCHINAGHWFRDSWQYYSFGNIDDLTECELKDCGWFKMSIRKCGHVIDDGYEGGENITEIAEITEHGEED